MYIIYNQYPNCVRHTEKSRCFSHQQEVPVKQATEQLIAKENDKKLRTKNSELMDQR